MTEHVRKRGAVHGLGETADIAAAIDRCNLKPEYKTLLKIMYVDGGRREILYSRSASNSDGDDNQRSRLRHNRRRHYAISAD